ncbi:hypothetical protein ACHAPC_005094 [Botrytis cinerea]|uniref:Putative pt repeat family protein n=1 Tax=Botryotinia fuckeliana (strain BcDW1) TaxID=1290391 RepID=M7U787_BOTF1|nr:putative pt repeat family protein [Botrytis cinerea BcDW1]
MADTKTSVVITYSKPGTAPPIYLAGSFPESGWQPREMEYKNVSNDHYVFSKAVEVEEGKEYQYKFRIGNGDWWMSDEDAPIVVDDIGNRNNLLSVPTKPSSHNKSSSDEENSTPRTIPETDIKASTMDTIIEPTQHTESKDKVSDNPDVETVTSVKDSPSDHGVETESKKPEETHETSLPVAEAGHAVESGKEAPELGLASVPAEELEVSTTGFDEPEHLESHAQSVTEEIKTATADLPDTSSVPVDELEVLDTEIKEPLNSESHAQQETANELKTTTETPDLHPTSIAQEASETSEDSPAGESNVPESKEIISQDDEVLHAETGTKDGEFTEQQKPAHSTIEESNPSESEKKEETTHAEEPASIQAPVTSEDVDNTKEEPVVAHIEESILEPEQDASKSEPKEETDLAVGDANLEEKLTEEADTSKSHSEPLISIPVIADETTGEVAEEPKDELKDEKLESSEINASNVVPPKESVESVSEDSGTTDQVIAQETDTTPKEEQPVSEPIVNEKPTEIESTTPSEENAVQEDDNSKATEAEEKSAVETSVDGTIEAQKPNDEIDSNSKESPDQEVVQQGETDKPVDGTESLTEDDSHPSIPIEVASAPIVSVEKVDSEPRLGDDFGSNATYAQKDAHSLHAQDASPDHITIRQQATTPDLANVAAEVADSAELLDETPPTPPMSDTEAGKIGYRRLSHTPIPEVAATAAEVADSAAQIDEDSKPTSIELPTQQDFVSRGVDDLERDLDTETPSEERAPLFAHECNGPPTAEERLKYESAQTQLPASEPMFREFDPNDPGLEPFPNNFNQILEHVRRLENHLTEDPAEAERNPLSPVTTNGNHHATASLTTPSPQSLAHESSPSLLPIVEENAEGESESKLTALPPSMEKSQADGNGPDEANEESGEQPIETTDAETLNTDVAELSEPAATEISKSPSPQLSATKFTEASGKLRPVLPDLPLTPFVEDKSLDRAEGSTTSSPVPGQDSPSITVQPATPAASVNVKVDPSPSEQDAAKTTSFAEEANDSQLRARKQPSSSAPDRSITPSSMRSGGNDAKSRNFLRAFFQVVFVDWIGGLIRKLCGGGRHT